MKAFEKSITAAAADIDELGHVNNAEWVRWMDNAAAAGAFDANPCFDQIQALSRDRWRTRTANLNVLTIDAILSKEEAALPVLKPEGGKQMRKIIVIAGCSLMTGGCVAAAIPMVLAQGAITGGAVVGADAWTKSILNKAERRQMTAAAIGHELNPRLINVSNAKRDGDTMRWTADTAIGHYSCSALKGRMTATCTKD